MARRAAATRGRGKTGHSDSPRQDTQRPAHSDHADAGGQESTTQRGARTQRAVGARPPTAPPVPGQQRADPPLPSGGRQPERPGQDARAEEHMGARDPDTLGVVKPEAGAGAGTEKPRPRRR
jgi:hypothetical protein